MSLTSIAKTKLALLSGPILAFSLLATPAVAQYCGDDLPFGECRVLVEINATDGDVGFHWLADGDELNATRIDDPSGNLANPGVARALREQGLEAPVDVGLGEGSLDEMCLIGAGVVVEPIR